MPTIIVTRKPGGQPGNHNAFRHGFYSNSYNPEELLALDNYVNGELQDELAVARVNAARLAELLKDYKTMPFEKVISACNALNNFLDRILALTRNYHFIYRKDSGTSVEQAMDELAALPPEVD